METLLLARHAFAGSNRDDVASCAVPGEGLTLEGIEQARALAGVLASDDISVALTSQLARTQETLAFALEDRGAPVVVLPELNEIDFGSFDGGSLETYRAWAATHSPSEPAPGGGESRGQAAARFARGLRLALRRPEASVLLVGHALMVRYALDAGAGLVPAARMAPVAHAVLQCLERHAVERAAALLEEWSEAPRFRDPSNEG